MQQPSSSPTRDARHCQRETIKEALYHRSKTEVSGDEFTQCVVSVRCLIEQALRPYFPKEDSDGYLTELDRADCSEFL